MKLRPLPFEGAALAECDPFEDPRGLFTNLFCDLDLKELLGDRQVRNINLSQSHLSGTLRGLHYQQGDAAEMKLVRCISGSIFDVIVDMRPDSPTYLRWHGEILTQQNMGMMIVPEYFAHGFQTLEDNTEVMYLVTSHYAPNQEAGVRWNDPAVGIRWPHDVTMLSDKDAQFPLLSSDAEGRGRTS